MVYTSPPRLSDVSEDWTGTRNRSGTVEDQNSWYQPRYAAMHGGLISEIVERERLCKEETTDWNVGVS